MTDDETLARLFAEDAPSAHDPAFVLGVTAAIHRRRLYVELVWAAMSAVAASAVLWAFGPLIMQVAARFEGLIAPLAPVLAVLAGVALVLRAWPHPPAELGARRITAN